MNRTLARIFTVSLLLMLPTLAFALVGAHDPASGGRGFICTSCHTGSASAVLYTANNVCTTCHTGANDTLGVKTKSFLTDDYKSIGADINYGGGAVPGRTASPKNTSHKWSGPDVVPAAKALAPTDPNSLNQYGLNRKGLTGQLLCVRCHAVHSDSQNKDPLDYDQSKQAPFVRALNTKDQMCLDCHRQRNTQGHVTGTHPVQVSYTSASVKAKASATPSQFKLTNGEPFKNVANPTAEMKNKKSLVVCSSCHGMHYADSDSATFDNHSTSSLGGLSASNGSLLRVSFRGVDNGADTRNICTNCHTKQHAGQTKQHAATSTIQCVDCHNAHVDTIDPTDPTQTPNAFLLRRYMNYSGLAGTGQVVQLPSYRKRAVYTDTNLATARWADATGTGICQSCHNLPSSVPEHAAYASNLSKNRNDCVVCHVEGPHTDNPPTDPFGSCTNCHGQPPQLAVSGDTANGGTLGGYSPGYTRYTAEDTTPHLSHAGATGSYYAYNCNECHLGSTHNNNYIELFLVKPAKAGASAAYTANTPPTASTCANIYCHSNGAGGYKAGQNAMSWNSGTGAGSKNSIIGLAAATRCVTCHDGSTISTGSHNKHVTTMGYGCATCHATTVSNNTTLLPSAYGVNGTHVNAVKDVSYSGTGAAIGTSCATVNCHGNGIGGDAVTVPTWGNAASGACGTCHLTATSAPVLSSGSHTTHITLIGGANASCVTCHTAYTSETAPAHADGTFTTPTGCNTCHSDPYSAVSNPPTWGTSASGCGACHTGVGAFTGTGLGPNTGSHNKHMAIAGALCNQCHSGAVAGTSGGTVHTDGNIDVTGGYPTNVTKHAAGSYTGTCSSTSCHVSSYSAASVVSPTWGVVSGCVACHTGVGAFTGTGQGPNTGSHNKHMALPSAGCGDCHAGASTSNGGSAHTDGNIDVTGGYATNVTKHTAGSGYTTCATATCHANPYSAASVVTPTWGVVAGCASCHTGVGAFTGTGSAPNTGTHNAHMSITGSACSQCHTGASTTSGGAAHIDGNIDVTGGYTLNVTKHTAGSGYASCSTSVCHLGTSPTWNASTANNQCTKCHGTATVTVTAATRYLVAPTDGAATDTGLVSANVKTGAHQTHLRFLNGFSNYSTVEYRCEACHGTLPLNNTIGHADTSSTPQGKFQTLATKWGVMSPTYSGTTCANTYCHNPVGSGIVTDAGTNPSPSWNDPTYIADGGKSLANCQKCHLVPGSVGFSKQAEHGFTTDSSANQCTTCHGHNGDTAGALGERHLDGKRPGAVSGCSGCHDYDTVGATYAGGKWTGGTWGKLNLGNYPTVNEGWGAHAKHINYIKTRLGIAVALTDIGQTFGVGQPANVCGSCHTNSGAHTTSATLGQDPTGRSINFGDSTFKIGGATGTSFLFGTSFPAQNPVYNGVSGTSSATTNKTCSNISCHYFTTPLWSTYP